MSKRKPELAADVRSTLETHGVLKAPEMPEPTVPKLDALLAHAAERQLEVQMSIVPEDEKDKGWCIAVLGSEWRGEDEFPAVAVANALAAHLESAA